MNKPINKDIDLFLGELVDAFKNETFVKLSLGSKRYKDEELNSLSAKIVEIKREKRLSIVYTYKTKDITKNYDLEGGAMIIETLLESSFLNANLFTSNADFQLIINSKDGRAKLIKNKPTFKAVQISKHDIEKKTLIDLNENIYLRELGISGADWKLKKEMSDKFRQINKYIELLDGAIKQTKLGDTYHIVDMGSGKGYLTFALYDYLNSKLGKNVFITGVEFRKDLVELCNSIAKKAGFNRLKFIEGTIQNAKIEKFDVLIALHACDTATDDALYRAIKANAELVVVAPCCHKQIRKEIKAENESRIYLKHGIFEERQAELITDGLRSAILETCGYKTKALEFISAEHTPKNIMIIGVKGEIDLIRSNEIKSNIEKIKNYYGIDYHYLEKLLEQ